MRADLHLHTTASDGAMTPTEMMNAAADAGMQIVSVTDHDTAEGVAESLFAGGARGLTVIPGIELSVGGAEEIHLLGYGLDAKDARLRAFLCDQLTERRERMYKMLGRLRALGMDIAPAETGDGRFMGRVNLARALEKHGHVKSVREAFDRYLNVGGPAYVPRRRIETPRGIEMLKSFGLIVSLAHPGRMKMDGLALSARLPGWVDAGLDGIEAYHASHAEADARRFDRMARGLGLLVTGGSDCHGQGPESARIGAHLRLWRTAEADVQALLARLQGSR